MRAYYAKVIVEQAPDLLKISKNISLDAFFSKKPFTDSLCEAGFTMISRLQKNTYMRYQYKGIQKGGRGRKKEYGDKIDTKNISTEHFNIIKADENEVVYEGIAHIRCLKRWCRVVIVQIIKDGKVHSALIYFATD